MSTDPVVAARAVVDALILDVRVSDATKEPALLIRVGQIATRVAAAEALARRGDHASAALIAAAAVRLVGRDFPGVALPKLDLLAEDRAYRLIAAEELEA